MQIIDEIIKDIFRQPVSKLLIINLSLYPNIFTRLFFAVLSRHLQIVNLFSGISSDRVTC